MSPRILAALTALVAMTACRSAPARGLEPVATSATAAPPWPRTVTQAVQLKLRTMPESEKGTIRQSARDRVQDMYHGFQMIHRADFGLSEGNEALLASCGSLTMPAEECMRIILDAIWVALQPPPTVESLDGR